MIYRTLTDEKSGKVTVVVEDTDADIRFSIPADDAAHARKLVKQAAKDGYETIRPKKGK